MVVRTGDEDDRHVMPCRSRGRGLVGHGRRNDTPLSNRGHLDTVVGALLPCWVCVLERTFDQRPSRVVASRSRVRRDEAEGKVV
jgi:hypothetical protein